MSNSRRSQDAYAPRPAMKVVGFRVEGVPPSPDQLHALAETTEGGGSPDPVIIPPAFQGTDSDRSVPVSPRRTNTLPSYVPDGSGSKALKDFWDEERPPSGRSSSERSPASNRLISSTSLPPFTDEDHMNLARQRDSNSEEDSPMNEPGAGAARKSPFTNRGGPQLSSSYKSPGYSLGQQWRKTDVTQVSATYSVGHRFPEGTDKGTRPIKVHMGATNSDGSKIVSPTPPDIGTPRVQHGFQLQKDDNGVISPSPFASRSSQTIAPSDLASVAEEPAVQPSKKEAQSSGLRISEEGSRAPVPLTSPSSEPATSRPSEREPAAYPKAPSAPVSTASGPSKGIPLPTRKGSHQDPVREDRKKGGQEDKKKQESTKDGKRKDASGNDKRKEVLGGEEEKKKSTKAERRAIQERQRAEKAAAKEAQEAGKKQEQGSKKPTSQNASQSRTGSQTNQGQASNAKGPSKAKPTGQAKSPGQTSEMFAHLQQYKRVTTENVFDVCSTALKVHPAILQLGLNIASGEISGGNARCLAMLLAFKTFIQDYQTPESKEMGRDLTSQLNLSVQFLVECRPLSTSMGTAIKNLKLKITNIKHTMEHEEAKEMLLTEIDTFIQEKITFADRSVAEMAQSKIENRDVVLTFAYSSAVLNTFLAAKEAGKHFRVIVVDSRPHYEGRLVLEKLSVAGIPCTYLQLNAICFIMKEVTKVFMGASGALSNGTILARTGSASVGLAAHAMQRPVIVCCETLKFVDRVQLDSITHNELGNPQILADIANRPDLDALKDWQNQPQLELLNLMYDAMPAKFVSMLVTEVGAIPPTSIPVILREYRAEPRI